MGRRDVRRASSRSTISAPSSTTTSCSPTTRNATIMGLEPLAQKWRAFGWHVHRNRRPRHRRHPRRLRRRARSDGSPTVIIAHTIKGKGVAYMEDVPLWHGSVKLTRAAGRRRARRARHATQAKIDELARWPRLNVARTHRLERRFAARSLRQGARRARAEYPQLVVLDADIAGGTGVHHFRKAHPDRFFQFGIAEQNMMAAAGGMAAIGLLPGRHDLRRLLPARHRTGAPLDRLRQAQREDRREPSRPRRRPRRRLGASARRHRRLPRHSRHDRDLARRPERNGASDQRDPRFRRPGLHAHRPQRLDAPLRRRPQLRNRQGPNPARRRRRHDRRLRRRSRARARSGRAARRREHLRRASSTCRRSSRSTPRCSRAAPRKPAAFVTAEDHNIYGGLGGAVAEALAQTHPAPIEFVGVRDRFGQSGEPEELAEHYGLAAPHIAAAARRVIARKSASGARR